MNYELLQDAVVARLQPFTTVGVSVIRLPETEGEKTTLVPTKARFTVIYAGSEYSEVNSTGYVSQDEKVFIQILIESTFLYGNKGIYALASVLKKALTGFKAQGTSKFQVTKHHTIGQPDAEKVNNMWQYSVVFQTIAPHVEDFAEDLSLILEKITYIDSPDGDTTVVPPED
jgi:Gp37 protein